MKTAKASATEQPPCKSPRCADLSRAHIDFHIASFTQIQECREIERIYFSEDITTETEKQI